MGGWITETHTVFVHQDDTCPGNCPSHADPAVCALYNSGSQTVAECVGHRNMDQQRPLHQKYPFKEYGPGILVKHEQENRLQNILAYYTQSGEGFINELAQRRMHEWYKSLPNPAGPLVNAGELIQHRQENIINDCISALNGMINQRDDHGFAHDSADIVSQHKVSTGDVISAENLKYHERNILASYRDCICYADCTCHGLSVYTVSRWCASYGDDADGY